MWSSSCCLRPPPNGLTLLIDPVALTTTAIPARVTKSVVIGELMSVRTMRLGNALHG
jgi:hypothetical protein